MTANIIPVHEHQLVCLEAACKQLAEARSIEEVEEIRDAAQAMTHYYRQRGYGLAAINDAAEVKIRAERRMGELLAENVSQGRPSIKKGSKMLPFLPDDVSKTNSSRWQRIAKIPDPVFEGHISDVRSKEQELTTVGVLRLAKELRQPGKQGKPPLVNGCKVEHLQVLVDDGEKFGTIYADPPWSYSNQATRASTDNHYQTMTVDDICGLPVKDLADDNAHLHLWTTNAFLRDSFRVMEAWGFTYQGVFVWCKSKMGIGNCWRVSHEFLMLGIRGEPRRFCKGAQNLMSWAVLPRDRHSSKPGKVRAWIEKASPGPYLELFARHIFDNWTVWGNEITEELFQQSIRRR